MWKFCIIHFWMILSMLVNHPKVKVWYNPLLDDPEHACKSSNSGSFVWLWTFKYRIFSDYEHASKTFRDAWAVNTVLNPPLSCCTKLNVKHGVCYGFEVLQTCESPKHPFHIFKTRFSHAPLIIYDNACRFHVYCLNREPHFFENTQFAVDRFHWCSHIGCSKGYSLDAYSQKLIKGINSQVNEQANLGLQKIRGQLAYMSVENFKIHCSLFFLALKNIVWT